MTVNGTGTEAVASVAVGAISAAALGEFATPVPKPKPAQAKVAKITTEKVSHLTSFATCGSKVFPRRRITYCGIYLVLAAFEPASGMRSEAPTEVLSGSNRSVHQAARWPFAGARSSTSGGSYPRRAALRQLRGRAFPFEPKEL